MFLEVLIIAGSGLGAVVLAAFLPEHQNSRDLVTVGVGMVGAAIGVWTGGRQARAGKNGNGNGHQSDYVSYEVDKK